MSNPSLVRLRITLTEKTHKSLIRKAKNHNEKLVKRKLEPVNLTDFIARAGSRINWRASAENNGSIVTLTGADVTRFEDYCKNKNLSPLDAMENILTKAA